MRLLVLLIGMLATCAAAQPQLGQYTQAETRYGQVEVRALSEFEKTVFFNDQRVVQITTRFIDILGAFRAQKAATDWVVLSTANGGNGCDAELVILGATPSGLTLTPPFGNCTAAIKDLRVYPDRIEIDVPSNDLFNAVHRYSFDGQNFTVADLPRPAGTQPTEPATRWVGEHPAFLLRSPDEQTRFLMIMSREDLDALYLRMTGPGKTIRDGDWVVGTACQRHQCNTDYAALAIRVSDGKLLAAYIKDAVGVRFFGGNYVDMPPAAQRHLACAFAVDPQICR